MKSKNVGKFSVQEDKPTDWFEPLYADANKKGEGVPWANMATHPSFSEWLSQNTLTGNNKSALVIGCGMGDDAIELEKLGFQVTAFDVSETAINFCKDRFPQSTVNFVQADLLKNQAQWHKQFDFVLEIYTVQALPPMYEKESIKRIADFVAPNGELLVIAVVSHEERAFENGPPWLLTPHHVDEFIACGLSVIGKNDEQNAAHHDEITTYITTFKSV